MQMLTTKDVADVLQVSDTTVKRYIELGKLRAERLPTEGAHRRIRRDDLEAFAVANDLTLDWSKLDKP